MTKEYRAAHVIAQALRNALGDDDPKWPLKFRQYCKGYRVNVREIDDFRSLSTEIEQLMQQMVARVR